MLYYIFFGLKHVSFKSESLHAILNVTSQELVIPVFTTFEIFHSEKITACEDIIYIYVYHG